MSFEVTSVAPSSKVTPHVYAAFVVSTSPIAFSTEAVIVERLPIVLGYIELTSILDPKVSTGITEVVIKVSTSTVSQFKLIVIDPMAV